MTDRGYMTKGEEEKLKNAKWCSSREESAGPSAELGEQCCAFKSKEKPNNRFHHYCWPVKLSRIHVQPSQNNSNTKKQQIYILTKYDINFNAHVILAKTQIEKDEIPSLSESHTTSWSKINRHILQDLGIWDAHRLQGDASHISRLFYREIRKASEICEESIRMDVQRHTKTNE